MNILTFDIEDWYNCDFISKNFNWDKYEVRIYDSVGRILDELALRNQKGTFFCLGWLAEHHPSIIKRIANEGHQVGCHSYQHELATRFTKEQFREDTYKAKSLIENVIGKEINVFRAPGFSITENNTWAFEVLVELGFKYDCSVFPSHHDYGGMPNYGKAEPVILKYKDATIKEFPINIHSLMGKNLVFSGGGFFRFFPYSIIKAWGKEADYMMCYFHPRDFDTGQPRIDSLPMKRKFKSYVGINGAFAKFKKILSDFDFVNVEEANSIIDWSKGRTIVLQ
jgi:polysaccharide deacetylase family protein (PEP-CTERM system associated)